MQAVFGFKTTEYKEQARIWKNSYGSSEFPGISLNGVVSKSVELQLVPVHDDDGRCICDPADALNKTGRGEIRVRHRDPCACVQYYRNPEATAAAFRDGWYYTGDVGEWAGVDKDGNRLLAVVDRVKNLCELYVDGDSKWLDAGRLELDLYCAAPCVKQICLVCDRNQPQMVALLVPSDGELQRWRPSGDSALADAHVEQNAEFAAYLLQQLTNFARAEASKSGRQLQTFELPCAVVVCAQAWSVDNGLLAANNKLKRGDLKKQFQKRTEDAYFAAFSCSPPPPAQPQATSSPAFSSSSAVALYFPCTTTAVMVPSPVVDSQCVTKVDRGRLYMQDPIDLLIDQSVKFAGNLPGGMFSDRVYAVACKSHAYPHYFKIYECGANGQRLQVQVADTRSAFTVHAAASLPAPLTSCIEELVQLTGSRFAESRLPAEALHRGRIKHDSNALPFLEGSDKQRDFIAFEFKGADDATAAQANEVLARLKALVQTYRKCAESWVEEAVTIKRDADASEAEQIKRINAEADAAFLKFMWCNEDATAGPEFADDGRSRADALERLLTCLIARVAQIKAVREETKRIKSLEPPSKTAFLKAYNVDLETLRVWAPRFGLRIPFEIEHSVWFQARVRAAKLAGEADNDTEIKQGIQNSLHQTSFGSVEVTCCVTGAVIQENDIGCGRPRYNNIDDAAKQCSVEGYALAQSVISAVRNMFISHHDVAQHMWAMLSRCPLFDAFMPDSPLSRAWCLEYNSSWHLLLSCFLSYEPGLHAPRDTPAGRIYRAFRAFANRPALGIPDAVAMKSHELLRAVTFRPSAFAAAMRIDLTPNRDYLWISFGDLGRMAALVAKILRAMDIPRGSFVAIAGYNDIEWAACDFACALSGLVSVGLHSTFDSHETLFALQNSGCVALLTSADYVLDNEFRGVDKPFWSVQSVFALAKAQQQPPPVSQIFLTDSCENFSNFSEIDAPVRLHSLVQLMRSPSKFHHVRIEHPDVQPEGGLDVPFTILHTSGSSGRPKQVVVKARGFASDIGTRNFAMPLVTCSYIPLSHSSDRYKLWEVCCSGGSVAFAFYSATHWLDHEQLKKSKALETGCLDGTDFNNVDSLLRQLQNVGVTAMSCPPNIWTGVYRMYKQMLGSGGMTTLEACERVRRLFGNRIQFLATGGAPTPSEIMSMVPLWFPTASFVDSYGATECGAISASGQLLTSKGVNIKVRLSGKTAAGSGVVAGELLVCSPNMATAYLNDEARTGESFIRLSRDSTSIFPPVFENDESAIWYATGDLVEVSYDQNSNGFDNDGNFDAWAQRISVKGRVSAQVKLSSGLAVSPDILEPTYCNSSLFSDVYISVRSNSSAVVAIVTPAPSLDRLKRADGSCVFEFSDICPKHLFESCVEGHRNEVGSQFYTRRRQVGRRLVCIASRHNNNIVHDGHNHNIVHNGRTLRRHIPHNPSLLPPPLPCPPPSSLTPQCWSSAPSQRERAWPPTRFPPLFMSKLSPGV